VEKQKLPVAASKDAVDVSVLNLWCTDGIKAFKLPEIQRVRFLNSALESEFKKALETLALSHDTQKKAVSIRCVGEGKRRVQVSYVVENPIWKTSYRLVLGTKERRRDNRRRRIVDAGGCQRRREGRGGVGGEAADLDRAAGSDLDDAVAESLRGLTDDANRVGRKRPDRRKPCELPIAGRHGAGDGRARIAAGKGSHGRTDTRSARRVHGRVGRGRGVVVIGLKD
jgi:hypothetical protein